MQKGSEEVGPKIWRVDRPPLRRWSMPSFEIYREYILKNDMSKARRKYLSLASEQNVFVDKLIVK